MTVQIDATPGEGLELNEYSGVAGSVTFAAGQTSRTFTVEFRGDMVDEPIETLTLSIGNVPAGYVAAAPAEAVLTLVDDDHPFDAASFGVPEAAASEGGALEEVVTLEREVVLEIEDRADSAGASLDDFDGVSDGVGFRDGGRIHTSRDWCRWT